MIVFSGGQCESAPRMLKLAPSRNSFITAAALTAWPPLVNSSDGITRSSRLTTVDGYVRSPEFSRVLSAGQPNSASNVRRRSRRCTPRRVQYFDRNSSGAMGDVMSAKAMPTSGSALVRGGDDGLDAAADGEVADDGHAPRLAGGDQVVENLIGDRLVEHAAVAEVDHVVLERLQLDAAVAGRVGDADLAEVGKPCFRADG